MSAEPVQISDVAARRAFRRDGMGWVWDNAEFDLTLRADYLTSRSEEFHAELTVERAGKHVYMARFNLVSTQSRISLAKALASRTEGVVNAETWEKIIERFSVGIMRKEREGEPTQHPQAAQRKPLVYLVDRLLIRGKSNMLFAPGGAGKGFLCVGLCCATASKQALADLGVMEARPFYFDWEDDFETFEDRLNRVAAGMGVEIPDIPYRRMRGLVSDRINEMARAMADEGANFGVIDSFSAAGGSPSDRIAWDTIAHRMFDALDMIPNVTWLIIDHVTGDKMDNPAGKAYGSIQKMNRVRNAWEMRSEQEAGSPTVHMKLFDAKWNHTGKRKPMGIRMEFINDGVTFDGEDPSDGGQIPGTSAVTKMVIQLATGPLTTEDLANRCNVKTSSIRAEVARHADQFTRDSTTGLIRLVRKDQDDVPW